MPKQSNSALQVPGFGSIQKVHYDNNSRNENRQEKGKNERSIILSNNRKKKNSYSNSNSYSI